MGFELAFYTVDYRLIALGMLAVLAAMGEVGFRAGSARRDAPDSFRSLMNGTGAATLGLLGLLLGFTLAMAIGRWDARRDILVSESNAIGTLWLRTALLEEPIRGEIRASLREYTEARITLGTDRDDLDQWRAAAVRSEALHVRLWSGVVRVETMEGSPAKLTALITATNDLIDLHELRVASFENYLPASLLLLLLGVATVTVYFLAWSFGAASHRGRPAVLLLALLVTAILLLIMDVNRPQRGAFQVGIETLQRTKASFSTPAAP